MCAAYRAPRCAILPLLCVWTAVTARFMFPTMPSVRLPSLQLSTPPRLSTLESVARLLMQALSMEVRPHYTTAVSLDRIQG